ncbi:hypothetical protein K438DRAFT_1987280 [Mycena galopus ATCC 62051]|nr:hypothetical protein K438DRAFT_1987280 [Mycena galopus ATCC 62051]
MVGFLTPPPRVEAPPPPEAHRETVALTRTTARLARTAARTVVQANKAHAVTSGNPTAHLHTHALTTPALIDVPLAFRHPIHCGYLVLFVEIHTFLL